MGKVKTKYCWVLSRNFCKQKLCWQIASDVLPFLQANFPAHNLNLHWRWRWWDWIQATFKNLFYFICPNALLTWVPTRWWQLTLSNFKIRKNWRSTPRLNSSQLSTITWAGNCHFTYDSKLLFHSFHIICTFFKLPSPIFDIFKSARTQTIFSKNTITLARFRTN